MGAGIKRLLLSLRGLLFARATGSRIDGGPPRPRGDKPRGT